MFLLPECHREKAVGEGRMRSTILSRTAPQPRAFLGALCQVLSRCPAADRGKTSGSAHLSLTVPVAAPFLEALCQVLGHCPAFGARTGRALQDCSALSRWRSDCFAIRGGAGAQAAQPMAERATASGLANG